MDLLVHEERKAIQAPMERLEMMAIPVHLDMMEHLENASIDQESLQDLVNMELQENQ